MPYAACRCRPLVSGSSIGSSHDSSGDYSQGECHASQAPNGGCRARPCRTARVLWRLGPDNAPRDDATTSTWSLERAEKEWDQFGIRYDEGFTPVDELEGSKDVKAYNEACKGFAEALRVNEEKAATGKWPGELKSKMDNFAVLLEKEAEAVDVCSNAKTMKQVDEGLRLQRRDSAGSAGMGIQHYFEEANAK